LTGCQRSITTGQTCLIGCAAGYSGTDIVWECKASGLTGNKPNCEAQTCENKTGTKMFTSHVATTNCTAAKTGDTCVAHCNSGYSGTSQTYTCDSTGFTGEAMKCKADPCDASHAVDNGDSGDCTENLASGRFCTINCNAGFTRQGVTDCVAGTLRNTAKCEPNPCDASEPPKYGLAGDCTSNLKSGATCQPTCTAGYTVSGTSSCDKGQLTAATCKADLQCHLVYKQNCVTQYGYWSDKAEHLNYPGCEHFCNSMYLAHKTIKGCELAAVTSAERNSVGNWCFAHEEPCSPGNSDGMAAADCVTLADE
jgi:hypothetical protein